MLNNFCDFTRKKTKKKTTLKGFILFYFMNAFALLKKKMV